MRSMRFFNSLKNDVPVSTDINNLPTDVIAEICKFLPISDLIPFLLTNKKHYRLLVENKMKLNDLRVEITGANDGKVVNARFNDVAKQLLEIYFLEQQKDSASSQSTRAYFQKAGLWIAVGVSTPILFVASLTFQPRDIGKEGLLTLSRIQSVIVWLALVLVWTVIAMRAQVVNDNRIMVGKKADRYYRINDFLEGKKRLLRNDTVDQPKREAHIDFVKEIVVPHDAPTRPMFRH
jgi:hypothetical protein